MGLKIGNITFDCADPGRVAAFWSAALDYGAPTGDAAEGNTWAAAQPADGQGPRLYFQRVPEPKTVKNRVHLDLNAADLEAAIGRLEALGARRVRRFEEAGETWQTMTDPEGNEFCVQPAG